MPLTAHMLRSWARRKRGATLDSGELEELAAALDRVEALHQDGTSGPITPRRLRDWSASSRGSALPVLLRFNHRDLSQLADDLEELETRRSHDDRNQRELTDLWKFVRSIYGVGTRKGGQLLLYSASFGTTLSKMHQEAERLLSGARHPFPVEQKTDLDAVSDIILRLANLQITRAPDNVTLTMGGRFVEDVLKLHEDARRLWSRPSVAASPSSPRLADVVHYRPVAATSCKAAIVTRIDSGSIDLGVFNMEMLAIDWLVDVAEADWHTAEECSHAR